MASEPISVVKVSNEPLQKLKQYYSLALASLLRSVCRNQIHQIRAQAIVTLQALLLECGSDISHLLGVEALLDDAGYEGSELRLLPLVLIGTELGVHEVQALECVVGFDASEHVHAAVLAGVPLDGR